MQTVQGLLLLPHTAGGPGVILQVVYNGCTKYDVDSRQGRQYFWQLPALLIPPPDQENTVSGTKHGFAIFLAFFPPLVVVLFPCDFANYQGEIRTVKRRSDLRPVTAAKNPRRAKSHQLLSTFQRPHRSFFSFNSDSDTKFD